MTDSLFSTGDGVRSSLERTAQADSLLRKLMRSHRKSSNGLAIFAVGGYGRSDNTLRSDLDLILLLRDDPSPHESTLRHLVQGLWDNSWSPAQTLLNIKEIDHDLLAIPDRASALLEARFIWGDRSLAHGLDLRLCAMFDEEVWNRYVELKNDEYILRQRKYGEVVRVIEPDLKSQAGGLRDLHHVFWIERARLALALRWKVQRKRSLSIHLFFNRLYRTNLLDDKEKDDLLDAFDLLLRVREGLRCVTTREENLLTVELQPPVGRLLGFEGEDSEVMCSLMRAVYHAMEKIARFSEEFGAVLSDYGIRGIKGKTVFSHFPGARQAGGRIYLDEGIPRRVAESPQRLMELVDNCVRSGVTLSGDARHSTRQEIFRVWNNRNEPSAWAKPLRDWFEYSSGVGLRLRRLGELDAIEPWLPEWGEVSGLTTGSYYHTYAVDEHTLRALEGLDNLPDDGPEGLPASLWKTFNDRSWVYISILLHDIAKSRQRHHSIEGAEIAVDAMKRLGWDDLTEPVSKLVSIHLRMEQVAFRRDASDPGVLEKFAQLIENERMLGALYLLTVCDLRAVRSGVWTSWKGRLLVELYIAIRNWFHSGEMAFEPTIAEMVNGIATHVAKDDAAVDRARRFLETMQTEYLRVVPEEEITQHMKAMEEVEAGKPFRWLINIEQGFVTLTLITRDRIGLMAQIAGLFVSQGIGIREARIFTREDGLAIDRFRAEDIEPNGVPLEERLEGIPELWERLTRGDFPLEQQLEGHRRRRKLLGRHSAVVETGVAVNSTENGWLIDVSGPDSVGLLYRLCTVLSSSGLDLRAARVTGRLDGIHDAFLVHDPRGLLDKPAQRKRLIERLREVISVEG